MAMPGDMIRTFGDTSRWPTWLLLCSVPRDLPGKLWEHYGDIVGALGGPTLLAVWAVGCHRGHAPAFEGHVSAGQAKGRPGDIEGRVLLAARAIGYVRGHVGGRRGHVLLVPCAAGCARGHAGDMMSH